MGLRTLRRSLVLHFGAQKGNIPIDDVHDTIVDENIRSNNFRGVDENVPILNRDCDIGTIHCFERGVAKDSAVANGTLHDVIFKNRCQLLRAQVSECGANRFECGV